MAGTEDCAGRGKRFDTGELKAIQSELASLGAAARSYPLEYSVGSLQLLFECRQDIDLLVDNLADEISAARRPV